MLQGAHRPFQWGPCLCLHLLNSCLWGSYMVGFLCLLGSPRSHTRERVAGLTAVACLAAIAAGAAAAQVLLCTAACNVLFCTAA